MVDGTNNAFIIKIHATSEEALSCNASFNLSFNLCRNLRCNAKENVYRKQMLKYYTKKHS